MSATIKAAILALKNRIAAAYTAISAKGGTLPATQDSANLPAAIASIPAGGGLSTAGYNYTSQNMEYLGQAVWPWASSREVTEIVDDYTDMNINNSTQLYNELNLNNIFPLATKIVFTKPGVYNGLGTNTILFRLSNVEYLSLPFTIIKGSNAPFGIVYQMTKLKTLKFPNLLYNDDGVYNQIAYNCAALIELDMPSYIGYQNSWRDICFLSSCNAIETLSLPNYEYQRQYNGSSVKGCSSLKYISFQKLHHISHAVANPIFYNCPALVSIQFGAIDTLSHTTITISNVALTYLEKFEVGQGTQLLPSLAQWTATNVADDTLLNTNIATYLAGRLYDYTGGTAHSITISTALYNRLTQATKDIFTNKNWTIVTA